MKTFDLKFLNNRIGKDDSNFLLDRISPSMVGVYLSCPLAFYYKFIAKIQIPDVNLHLLFGTSIHKVIEEMSKGDDNPARWFDLTFKYEDLDDVSKLRYNEFKFLGNDMVKNLLEIYPTINGIYNLEGGLPEHRFKKPLINPITGEPSRIPVSGVLDKYLTGNRVLEIKTSAKKWSSKETRFKVQSRLYSLWAYTETGKIPDEVIYLILLKQLKRTSRDKTIQIIRYKPTIEDLAEAWEELDTILDKIEHGHFDRGTVDHPYYCDCVKYEKLLGLRY
jgi:CRISPR/Cas system-associated exonuclease Cas4 (RecB family)